MSSFTAPLELKEVTRFSEYRTVERDFIFYYDDPNYGMYVSIKKGRLVNGASWPRKGVTGWIIKHVFKWDPFDPRWCQATVVHDALVGEAGAKAPVYFRMGENRVIKVDKELTWFQATLWFNRALAVKQRQYPECPLRFRVLFVTAVGLYGVFNRIKFRSKS